MATDTTTSTTKFVKRSVREVEFETERMWYASLIERCCMERTRVHTLKFILHHSTNSERSIAARRESTCTTG